MAFLWLLSCFAFIGASYGSRDPASEPELSIVPRIINGKDAGSSSAPWHVSLENSSGKLICGGSLINRNWVITAAHCRVRVYDWVVAGLHDRRAYGNKIQFVKIGKIFRYPEFNISTFYGNFALLKLITQVNFQRTVSAIALPSVDDRFPAGSQCKIVGWGHTRRHGKKRPDKLQEATVPILNKVECQDYWGHMMSSDMICVGANGVSCWKGDVGGSLVCKKEGVWTLVGIIVVVSRSCPTHHPMMAISLSKYKGWIESTVVHN